MEDLSDVGRYARVGRLYPEKTYIISEAKQAEVHRCCGVDSARFGGMADAGILANLHNPLWLAVNDPATSVQLELSVIQELAIPLGEPFTMSGQIVAVEPAPRGHRVSHCYEFTRNDGTHALTITRTDLRLGASLAPRARHAPSGPGPDPSHGLERIFRRAFTPEGVMGYSAGGTGIHRDPEFARKRGYRAPLAAAMMVLHWMLETLAAERPYKRISMRVISLRPMFWDEEMTLWGRRKGASYDLLRVVNPDGKAAAEGAVQSVSW